MNYPEEARKILREFQKKAFRYENREIMYLFNKWQSISSKLEELINELSNNSDVYKEFLVLSNNQVSKFNKIAMETVIDGQKEFAQIGLDIARESIELITVNFHHINIQAVNNMIGLASDGSPLYKLFAKSYPESIKKLTNTLVQSTALGYNPQKTAKLLMQDMNGNFNRALTIARTEQLNVLRLTSIEQMKQSGVCKGWIRIEQPDACEDCSEENGKKYGFDETFDTHPNCRGACIPDLDSL